MLKLNSPIERHRMVWIDPAKWGAVITGEPALADEPLVAGWAGAGWPVISRRAMCNDTGTMAPLGLPLPPAWGKGRLALRVPFDAIVRDAPAPLLSDAAPAAPAAWRDTVSAVIDFDPDVRCFGSLAWQHLTGLDYVTATSDLDLLWSVGDAMKANALAQRIECVGRAAPMRIDGELIAPGGRAVQWLEWRSEVGMVLVKGNDRVRLIARDEVFQCAH